MSKSERILSMTRWRHKCPNCKQLIFNRNVYCRRCIAADKRRQRSTVDSNRVWLGGFKLNNSRNMILGVVIGEKTYCVSCGQSVADSLKHSCSVRFRPLYMLRRMRKTNKLCVTCKESKTYLHFPVITNGRRYSLTKICSSCLSGKDLVRKSG